MSSVTAAPDWSSYSSIFAASDSEDLPLYNTKDFTDVTADPLFTALPDGVQSYAVSQQNAEVSIAIKDGYGDTSNPTNVATTVVTDKVAISKANHDLDSYLSSVTAAPDWSSYSSIFAASDSEDLLGSNTKDFTDVTADPLFTALPNGAQSYLVSIVNAGDSIVNKDLYGDTSKPTSGATSVVTGNGTGSVTGNGTGTVTGKAASTANSTGGAALKPTGAVMAAGAAAAGFLGVIVML